MVDASPPINRPSILDVAETIARTRGFEPPTPRWRATLAYLYGLPLSDSDVDLLHDATHRSRETIIAHARRTLGRRRFNQFWARVGRRGRKSATAALIVVYEAIWGGHERYLIPGEQGLCAVISRDLAGSTVVTRFVRAFLDALGMRYSTSRIGAVAIIEIEGCSLAIASLAATADAPRGFAIAVLLLDEFAHGPSGEEYVDSDTERLRAAEPAMLQFPDRLLVGISTPLGASGEFHARVERGLGNDAEESMLSVEGPTWLWSPELTFEQCRKLEADDDTFWRELGAQPSDNEGTAFVRSDADACFAPHPGLYHWGQPFMVIDPAETTNTFSWCVANWGDPSREKLPIMLDSGEGPDLIREAFPARDSQGNQLFHRLPERRLLRIFAIGGWTGPELRETTMDKVSAQLATIARENGADTALSDRRGDVYLAALLSQHRIRLRSFTVTNNSKHEAVKLMRTLMRDRQVSIVDHDGMHDDLRTYPRRISGGLFRYGEARSSQKKHWDHASLLVTLAHGMLEESGTAAHDEHFRIEGAPTKKAIGERHQVLGR